MAPERFKLFAGVACPSEKQWDFIGKSVWSMVFIAIRQNLK